MQFNFNQDTSQQDPLKEFGRNLNDEAVRNKLDPIIGRDEEIRRIIRILSRKTKNNPILVGEPGVGKTAIAEGLAQKIIQGDVPENLKDKEIIELDVASLIAGASFQGQFEKRLKSVMKAIKKAEGNIIIFIDEIHTLIGAGKNAQGGMDGAQILKPMLAKGEMKLIGATTLDEHKKYIESDPAFERRLQMVKIQEPSPKDALTILRGIKERYENYHKVKIHDQALVQAVKLSDRYIADRFLPDKAIDLIDEAAAGIQTQVNSKPEKLEKLDHQLAILAMEKAALTKEKDQKSKNRLLEIDKDIKVTQEDADKLRQAWEKEKELTNKLSLLKERLEFNKVQQQRLQAEGNYEKASALLYKEIPAIKNEIKKLQALEGGKLSLIKETVTADDVADVVARWTGIPIAKLMQQQKDKLIALEKHLALRIKGQTQALKIVSDAILRSRVAINDPNKPIGSFIFMGPTGVGKTEVAKALAEELFDSEKALIRIDMSEYMQEHSVARLIGAPPGYVGYEQGGQLSDAVHRKPYSIILFDEIEKAHPKVLDLLLQIMDDGQVTDNQGKTVNFKNTIIILTTNIGALDILDGKKDQVIIKQLDKHLKPEFINRIDEVVVFSMLDKKTIKLIVKNELDQLTKRLQEQDYQINFHQNVIDKVAHDAYDPNFGARPIKRYIQKHIESNLAKAILSNNINKNTPFECILNQQNFVYQELKMN